MNTPSFATVRAEALEAYADSTPHDQPNAMTRRNLSWRAPGPVTRDEAIMIMLETCPSYNLFTPSLLKKLPAEAMVTLAREGSVCVYVDKTGTATVRTLKADEWHPNYQQDGLTRIWWD